MFPSVSKDHLINYKKRQHIFLGVSGISLALVTVLVLLTIYPAAIQMYIEFDALVPTLFTMLPIFGAALTITSLIFGFIQLFILRNRSVDPSRYKTTADGLINIHILDKFSFLILALLLIALLFMLLILRLPLYSLV